LLLHEGDDGGSNPGEDGSDFFCMAALLSTIAYSLSHLLKTLRLRLKRSDSSLLGPELMDSWMAMLK